MNSSGSIWSTVRILILAVLITASSVLAGASRMMGGIIALALAVVLVFPAAVLQRRHWPMLRGATSYWSGCTTAAAFVGGIAGLIAGTWYGGGRAVLYEVWMLQPTLVGAGMGVFIGLTQWLCVRGRLKRPWLWIALTTVAYAMGAAIVDQPVPALAPFFVLTYALVVVVLGIQTRAYSSQGAGSP